MKIYVKFYLENGKVRKIHAKHFIRRILSQASLVRFKKAYIRVEYDDKLKWQKDTIAAYNDGYYTDPKELTNVIKIFWNEG